MISQRQVVYLTTSPLSKRDYDRYGIQRWLDRCWNIKVVVLIKFIKPLFRNYVNGDKLSVGFNGLKVFEDGNATFKIG